MAKANSTRSTSGWPVSLTPSKLAALQYPNEGTLQEKRAAILSRNAFLALVKSALDAGAIETVVMEAQAYGRNDAPANCAPNGLGSLEWRERDFVAAPALSVGTSSNAARGITRNACASWFRATREIPRSDYVRAWLGDEWQDEAQEAAQAVPAATSEPTQAIKEKRIVAIVATACRLKYEPQKIAWGGKAAIKVECLKDAKLFTGSTFDKAWQAAVKAKKIKVNNSEAYAKR